MERALEAMERAAALLADANRCEAAWALRGTIDALRGEERDPDALYPKSYLRGYAHGETL